MTSYKTGIEEFAELRQELREFIGDRADLARFIVSREPTGRILTSSNKEWAAGWDTGFRRCLAEVKRIAELQAGKENTL